MDRAIASRLRRALPVPALQSVAALLLVLALAACASPVEDSWTNPSIAGRPLALRKVATIAMLEEGARRRVAEDELAKAIEGVGADTPDGVEAEPSYAVLEADELEDAKAARARLREAGFDGAVTLSIVDREQQVRSSPNASVGWGRYGFGGLWGISYGLGSVRSDDVVHVQFNIYDLVGDELLWSGTTRSTNPRGVDELVRDVIHDVGRALRDEGLLPEADGGD